MINDEKRVTEIADMVGAEVFDHNEFACVFDSKEKLLAFEQECIKREGLEVLALREALDNALPDDTLNQDEMGGCVFCGKSIGKHGYGYATNDPKDHESDCPWILGKKALTNSEASAKRIKAGIESDVLEEAVEFFAVNDLFAYQNLLHMAEERRAIKGEK